MPLQPYAHMIVGQAKRYLGRKYDPETKEYKLSGPYECEEGTPEAKRCKLFVRRGEAVPADKSTADACGVPFASASSSTKSSKSGSGQKANEVSA